MAVQSSEEAIESVEIDRQRTLAREDRRTDGSRAESADEVEATWACAAATWAFLAATWLYAGATTGSEAARTAYAEVTLGVEAERAVGGTEKEVGAAAATWTDAGATESSDRLAYEAEAASTAGPTVGDLSGPGSGEAATGRGPIRTVDGRLGRHRRRTVVDGPHARAAADPATYSKRLVDLVAAAADREDHGEARSSEIFHETGEHEAEAGRRERACERRLSPAPQ